MSDNALYSTIATHIVNAQFTVIGPLAFDQARKVTGIEIDAENTVSITGNGKDVIASLVKKFELLFGQASVDVCKDAIRELHIPIKPEDLPEILK